MTTDELRKGTETMTYTQNLTTGMRLRTGAGEIVEIVETTTDKIAIADPSALNHRNAPSVKWYKRTSKILARWTVVA